jgi:hypothetical protein
MGADAATGTHIAYIHTNVYTYIDIHRHICTYISTKAGPLFRCESSGPHSAVTATGDEEGDDQDMCAGLHKTGEEEGS